MANISEKSFVSLSLLITCVGAAIGGALWLTNIRWIALDALAQGEAVDKKTEIIQQRIDIHLDRTNESIKSIDSRLSRIEGQIDFIYTKQKHNK